MNLEECYYLIGRIQALYGGLEERSQHQLIVSLNKNPVAHVVRYPPDHPNELRNYDLYEKYFLYHPIKDDERVYFVCKKDIFKVRKNLHVLVQNEWIKMPWKLN